MVGHTVSAQLTFSSTDEGGLQGAMASPTPSLILLFASLDEELGAGSEDVQIGAVVDVGGSEIQPASARRAILTFWSDAGRIYATPGAHFRLWYAGRVVGDGHVIEEVLGCP